MRIKLDMSAANKALRDPVAFRCNLTHHWRTGHEYKVGLCGAVGVCGGRCVGGGEGKGPGVLSGLPRSPPACVSAGRVRRPPTPLYPPIYDTPAVLPHLRLCLPLHRRSGGGDPRAAHVRVQGQGGAGVWVCVVVGGWVVVVVVVVVVVSVRGELCAVCVVSCGCSLAPPHAYRYAPPAAPRLLTHSYPTLTSPAPPPTHPTLPCPPQFYMILKLQQGVWPGLPDVHIWDYAR